jgi:death on curing protein
MKLGEQKLIWRQIAFDASTARHSTVWPSSDHSISYGEEVLHLHRSEVGDDVGLRDRHLLEGAVERPQQSAFGTDAYPSLASKAAALLESLVKNHPFLDGNKRIGVLASFVFVELNGFEFEATNDDVVDTVIALIVRDIEFNELVTRFESWLRPT